MSGEDSITLQHNKRELCPGDVKLTDKLLVGIEKVYAELPFSCVHQIILMCQCFPLLTCAREGDFSFLRLTFAKIKKPTQSLWRVHCSDAADQKRLQLFLPPSEVKGGPEKLPLDTAEGVAERGDLLEVVN